MKKSLMTLSLLGVLTLTGCSSEEPMANGGDSNVATFVASLPGDMMSRADVSTTDMVLKYAVFEATDGKNGQLVTSSEIDDPATVVNNDNSFIVSIPLVHGKTYDFVFWVQSKNSTAYKFENGTISVDYDKMTVNNDDHDAFFTSVTKTVDGEGSSVTLKRPMAQLNVATNDYEAAGNVTTTVTIGHLHNQLDLRTGVASGPDQAIETVHQDLAPLDAKLTLDGKDHTHLVKAYVLTGSTVNDGDVHSAASETMNVKIEFSNGRSHQIDNVPVRRNNRTNLYGALLTTNTDFTIDLDDEFENSDNVNLENLKELAPGVYQDTETEVYQLTSAEGFRWMAENHQVGKKETITLGADIDFEGEVAEPIVCAWQSGAVFDGKGFTFKNVKLDATHPNLFEGNLNNGRAGWVGTVKNINIDGMTVENPSRFCGLVGNLYGHMENVHVKNVTIVSPEGRVGALVGIHNSGSLKNCSIENVDITGSWSVGGMVGCINETRGMVYENLTAKNVKATNTGAYGGVYNTMVGAIVGDINIGGVVFRNCVVEGCVVNGVEGHTLPILHAYNDYEWNGQAIAADIDESGNPVE